jgi:hypothetical protein
MVTEADLVAEGWEAHTLPVALQCAKELIKVESPAQCMNRIRVLESLRLVKERPTEYFHFKILGKLARVLHPELADISH